MKTLREIQVRRMEKEVKQIPTSINRTFLDWLKTINFIIKNNELQRNS